MQARATTTVTTITITTAPMAIGMNVRGCLISAFMASHTWGSDDTVLFVVAAEGAIDITDEVDKKVDAVAVVEVVVVVGSLQ